MPNKPKKGQILGRGGRPHIDLSNIKGSYEVGTPITQSGDVPYSFSGDPETQVGNYATSAGAITQQPFVDTRSGLGKVFTPNTAKELNQQLQGQVVAQNAMIPVQSRAFQQQTNIQSQADINKFKQEEAIRQEYANKNAPQFNPDFGAQPGSLDYRQPVNASTIVQQPFLPSTSGGAIANEKYLSGLLEQRARTTGQVLGTAGIPPSNNMQITPAQQTMLNQARNAELAYKGAQTKALTAGAARKDIFNVNGGIISIDPQTGQPTIVATTTPPKYTENFNMQTMQKEMTPVPGTGQIRIPVRGANIYQKENPGVSSPAINMPSSTGGYNPSMRYESDIGIKPYSMNKQEFPIGSEGQIISKPIVSGGALTTEPVRVLSGYGQNRTPGVSVTNLNDIDPTELQKMLQAIKNRQLQQRAWAGSYGAYQ